MSILAAMFVTLFNSYCSVCLKKDFFPLLQHRKIAKREKANFFKLNNCQKNFSFTCAEQQLSIILNSSSFACRRKKVIESAQNLVTLHDLNFIFVCF